jgi:hypothetical protein
MDLFNQPNVNWDGGKSWLTTQIYLQREAVADAVLRTWFYLNDKTK